MVNKNLKILIKNNTKRIYCTFRLFSKQPCIVFSDIHINLTYLMTNNMYNIINR